MVLVKKLQSNWALIYSFFWCALCAHLLATLLACTMLTVGRFVLKSRDTYSLIVKKRLRLHAATKQNPPIWDSFYQTIESSIKNCTKASKVLKVINYITLHSTLSVNDN